MPEHHQGSLLRARTRREGQPVARTLSFRLFGATHCAQIHVPCCHPRLLVKKLHVCDLSDPARFPMLDLFVEHYKAWRQCLQKYMDVPIDAAKTELIRIFYVGQPTIDIPFLLKLSDRSEATSSASSFIGLHGALLGPMQPRIKLNVCTARTMRLGCWTS